MAEAKKKESNLKTIKNVLFFYSSVSRPQKQLNKDNKPALSDDPFEFHGWEVKILIPLTTIKKMKEKWPNAKNFPNAKEFEPHQCVSKLGMEEEPDQEMVLVKFTQMCLYGKKNMRKAARPIAQIGIKARVQDRNGLTIDAETSLGNGTKGHLQFNPVDNEHGTYLYPVCLCVTELVEYVSEAGGYDDSAFGMEDLDEVTEDEFTEEETEAEDDEFDDPQF